jgi:peptide/nickel transport system permease protein
MLVYVMRRCLAAVLVILGVMTLVFFMLQLLPGDATSIMLADFGASAEQQARLRAELGLDRPLLVQYAAYMADALRGDFGRSLFTGRPALEQVLAQIPKTIELAVAAIVVAIVIGVLLGVLAAVKRNTWWDTGSMVIAMLALSLPNFWLGLVFIFVFSLQLGWFPVAGSASFAHLILPAAALGLSAAGLLARLVRSSMLEVLRQDFVTTARSKGLSPRSVVVKHALRNAMIPVVTVIGINFGYLLGGSVVMEMVYARQGVGNLIVRSIFSQDFYVVQAGVLLTSCLFIVATLIVDLTYAFLDPRIRHA